MLLFNLNCRVPMCIVYYCNILFYYPCVDLIQSFLECFAAGCSKAIGGVEEGWAHTPTNTHPGGPLASLAVFTYELHTVSGVSGLYVPGSWQGNVLLMSGTTDSDICVLTSPPGNVWKISGYQSVCWRIIWSLTNDTMYQSQIRNNLQANWVKV